MEALTPASFTSSVVTTLDSWRAFVDHDPRQVTLLTDDERHRLNEGERRTYDDMRADYHAALPALRTPILDRTVTKGLLFMRLNRGLQMGTPCGMILSGVPGVGKTTAIRALGRTVEQTLPGAEPADELARCRSYTSRCRPGSIPRRCPLSSCTSSAHRTPRELPRRCSPTRRAS